jgi:integrase
MVSRQTPSPLPPPALLAAIRRLPRHPKVEGHGPARQRQVRWVVGELLTLLQGHDEAQEVRAPTPTTLAEVFGAAFMDFYLSRADAGALRTRPLAQAGPGKSATRPSPLGAQRARRSVLRILAAAAGQDRPPLSLPDGMPRPAYVPDQEARKAISILFREVTSLPEPRRTAAATVGAQTASNDALLVRTALVAGLVYFHDLRLGEIAALDLDDIVLPDPWGRIRSEDSRSGIASLTYVPDPPGESGTYAAVTVELAPALIQIARIWMDHRERQVAYAANNGRTRALLVSVRWGHGKDGSRRPPGLPIHARSLTRGHTAALRRLNGLLAAREGHSPDWEPLDHRLGALRPHEATQQPR